jgi:hypothetical protein
VTHLPFIAACYGLGVLVPGGFGLAAFLRMRSAQRRLAAIDPRANRARTGSGGGGRLAGEPSRTAQAWDPAP